MSLPDPPARPMLRPGVLVCRRSAAELQVGLDPALATVVPDLPATREALAALRHGSLPHPTTPEVHRLLLRLHARGLLVDGDTWLAALAEAPDDAGARAGVTAAVAEGGADAGRVLAVRRSTGVLVDDLGLPGPAARCRELLDHAGLGAGQDLVVLACGREPDRDLVDHWSRTDVPHVLLVLSEGAVRLGPFVDPGRTACLRCLDAHLAERDPRRGIVVRQYAGAAPPGPLPEPAPSDLLDLAVGYLARDVARWADGHRPRLWSATLRVDPALELTPVPWPRHPGCGCAWSEVRAG